MKHMFLMNNVGYIYTHIYIVLFFVFAFTEEEEVKEEEEKKICTNCKPLKILWRRSISYTETKKTPERQ